MTNFERCIPVILDLEGGYTNHPEDKGGPTKYGITQRTLQYYRTTPVSARDVENLSVDEAAKIYLVQFWNPMGLGNIKSWKISLVLFSHAVHMGPQNATKGLQRVLNQSFKNHLFEDGVFGPKTELALAMVKQEDLFCRKLLQWSQSYYVEIVRSKFGQLVFLQGWLNRTFKLWDLVA